MDWIAVGRVVAVSKEAPIKLEWNHAACIVHGIETEATRSRFEEFATSSAFVASIAWSG